MPYLTATIVNKCEEELTNVIVLCVISGGVCYSLKKRVCIFNDKYYIYISFHSKSFSSSNSNARSITIFSNVKKCSSNIYCMQLSKYRG
jgi:hypothetical protein